jgi:nucleotide-binding universal stress UspA family protein
VARFDEVRQLVGGLSVPVRENSSTLGRPDVKLVDTAREIRAGIIAIGAFGRNRISEYFLGSNATSIVRSSPVAVLLAR